MQAEQREKSKLSMFYRVVLPTFKSIPVCRLLPSCVIDLGQQMVRQAPISVGSDMVTIVGRDVTCTSSEGKPTAHTCQVCIRNCYLFVQETQK